MKRGFGLSSRALGALCSIFLLVMAAAPAQATSFYCPADRVATVLYLDNEHWRSDLVVTSPTGATARTSDCQGFSRFSATIAAQGSVLTPDFVRNLCERKPIAGIARLRVQTGCASYATEATFHDGTTVFIPELVPLRPRAAAVFDPVENAATRATFVALLTESGSTRATLTVYDGENRRIGTESVNVDGFLFYELQTTMTIGRLEVENTPPVVGPYVPADLYAVAIVGARDRGAPRVVAPTYRGAVTIP